MDLMYAAMRRVPYADKALRKRLIGAGAALWYDDPAHPDIRRGADGRRYVFFTLLRGTVHPLWDPAALLPFVPDVDPESDQAASYISTCVLSVQVHFARPVHALLASVASTRGKHKKSSSSRARKARRRAGATAEGKDDENGQCHETGEEEETGKEQETHSPIDEASSPSGVVAVVMKPEAPRSIWVRFVPVAFQFPSDSNHQPQTSVSRSS